MSSRGRPFFFWVRARQYPCSFYMIQSPFKGARESSKTYALKLPMSFPMNSSPSPSGILARDRSGAPNPVERMPRVSQILSSKSSVNGRPVISSSANPMSVYAWFE